MHQRNENNHSTFEIHENGADSDKNNELPNPKLSLYHQLILNLHTKFLEYIKQNRNGCRLFSSFCLYGLFTAYFGWATYYFLNASNDLASTTCSGYGLLMVLFIIFIFFLLYKPIVKTYILSPLYELIWNKIEEKIRLKLGNKLIKTLLYCLLLLTILAYLVYDTRQNPSRLIPIGGLVSFLLLGYLISTNPSQIDWHPVFWGLILQFLFGLLTIRWEVGRNTFECIGNKTTVFLNYAKDGAAFVYGDFIVFEKAVFIFEALSTIYFLSLIINVLYHYGIMQKLVVVIGEFLSQIMGTTICESVNSAANIFLGMSEAPLLLKPYLQTLTDSEMHSIMAAGFASVSGSVLAAYISFGAKASHLITASVMSAPAVLCYSKLIYPETEKTAASKETIALIKSEYSSVLDAASKGASFAIDVVLGIAANLIAFIAFVYFLNGIILWMGELVGYSGESAWSIELFAGYVFMPVSFIMGVPWEECESVGKLIGIKTIINEFAAYKEMGKMVLTPRTKLIATYAICGFSNPGSVGITISTLSVLIPGKRDVIINTVMKAFFCGIIVCFMTACIAAVLVPDIDV